MKKTFFLLNLIAFCLLVGKGVYWMKKGFSFRRIAAPSQMELVLREDLADEILTQPFKYLARGRQCFAFESLDGNYVLKLPRTDIYQIPFWVRAFPSLFPKRSALWQRRKSQEDFVLNSMRIACESLSEETGTLALHFGQTPDRGQTIRLIDPLGFTYLLPAHKITFALQRKHPLLMKSFKEALRNGDRVAAKALLGSLIDVVIARGKKEIWNKDGSFLRNYGYDGKKAIQIDIGSFYRKPGAIASIRETMQRVRGWLGEVDPEMLAFLESEMERKIETAFSGNEKLQ